MSQRLLIALAPCINPLIGSNIYVRDITQAYIQSNMHLNREIYATLPKKIVSVYPPGTIMRVIKPLSGLAESGLFWWATYHRHHRDKLLMKTSTFDPCLMISDPERAPRDCFGIIAMQTDDTLILATKEFDLREEEKVMEAKLLAKPKVMLSPNQCISFNGCTLNIQEDKITIRQKGQGSRIQLLYAEEKDKKQLYIRQRARGAYIASKCQPEACYDLSKAAQVIDPEGSDCAELNKRLKWLMENMDRGLTYVTVDLNTSCTICVR